MIKISDRIKELREAKGIQQKELAIALEIGQSTISQWESGRQEPNPRQRIKLCRYFGISEAELFGAASPSTAPVQRVPVISWVHANRFEEIHDPFPVGISDEYIYATSKCKGIFALKVNNDCMDPEFREGDIIIVCPGVDVGQNDYIVVADRDKNEATFKQLKIYGNKRVLHPLNPKYEDIELDHKKRYVIIGKVIAKEKKY